MRASRWSLGLSGVYLPSHATGVRDGSEQVELTLIAGGPRACYSALDAAMRLDACAGVELGRFSASGVALRDARTVRELWLAPGAGVGLDWPVLADLSLVAHVDVLAPLAREEYVVNASEVVHRVPPALLRVGLGVKLAPE